MQIVLDSAEAQDIEVDQDSEEFKFAVEEMRAMLERELTRATA